MADVSFEVKVDFGGIGGKKKLTFTSWNGNAPRYDIRDWYENEKCGKGITLDKEELLTLYKLLEGMFEDKEEVTTEETVEEETEEESIENVEEQMSLFDTAEEPKEEVKADYPAAIKKIFKILNDLFKGFEVEAEYGKMPFADGNRIQYLVKKSDDSYPDYHKTLETLELKSFITNKGNLYIYTL